MKKIMILGAGVYQVPIIQKAKEKGLYTIAVSPRGNYPGLKIADKTYDLDVRDQESILEIAREEGISGITTDQTDIAIRAVAYVAEKMQLPGIGYECAKLFTDKFKMRKKSEELGLPTIRNNVVYSLEAALEFFNETDKSVMIKPVDNQGSRGVFRVDTEGELVDKFEEARRFSHKGKIIIEEYIEGDEYEVDSIVLDGREHMLMCGDVTLFDVPGIFASKTRLYPSAGSRKVLEKLYDLNKKTIEGFGLKQGLTHSEYLVDKTGQPYLIEAAARGGGAFVSSYITELQTGLNTAEFLIDAALGIVNKDMTIGRELCHCGTLSFYLPKGRVVSLEGIDRAKNLPFVKAHLLDEIKLGMETVKFSDKTSRYISVLVGNSRQELLQNIALFRDTVKTKVNVGNEIQGPVWG